MFFVFLRKGRRSSLAGRSVLPRYTTRLHIPHLALPCRWPTNITGLEAALEYVYTFSRGRTCPTSTHETTPRLNGKLRHRRGNCFAPAWCMATVARATRVAGSGYSSDCRDAPCQASVVAASARVVGGSPSVSITEHVLEDHRGHRASSRDCQDPHTSRLAGQSTAPPRRRGYSIDFK